MKKLILASLTVFAMNFANAQAPESIKYQAVVRDGMYNIIASQAVGVQVRILQGSTSGSSVYTETHSGTTNNYGLMNLAIGSGVVSSGTFSGIDWSSGPYFIEISVDVSGGTSYQLMGASQLLSVPYALHAKSADNVDDADADPANEFNTSASLVGSDLNITDGGGTLTVDLSSLGGGVDPSPTNELNTNLQLNGTTLELTDAGGMLTVDLSSLGGSGGNWTASGNNIYNANSGFVGINQSNPQSQLHINATTTTAFPNGARIVMNNPSGTAYSSALFIETSGGGLATTTNGIDASTVISGGTGKSRGVAGLGDGSTVQNTGVSGVAGPSAAYNIGLAGFGTYTSSGENYGVYGRADLSTNQNVGVLGLAEGSSSDEWGVFGAYQGTGVGDNAGVRGFNNNSNTASNDNFGVKGIAQSSGNVNVGTYGLSNGTGALSNNYNIGVWGQASGANNGNWAGWFQGDVYISGTLAKGGGSFKIDHPQDPGNKYLVHSFVESPDMMNIYNGNITTDANGFATVELPSYFEASNKEFRYQLTVIGGFAQAIVKEEVIGNQFVIQTSEPNVKVSWQVTGIRADKWADAHRIVPEVDKEQSGTYLHPELYGMPAEQSVIYIEEKESKEVPKIDPN